jgi:hypothetical protein
MPKNNDIEFISTEICEVSTGSQAISKSIEFRIPKLTNPENVKIELGRLYKRALSNKVDQSLARTGTYILSVLLKAIELEIEKKDIEQIQNELIELKEKLTKYELN